MNNGGLWPTYASPADLAAIEVAGLSTRGIPASTYDILGRAAARWPDRTALIVLPDATHWQQPTQRTFSQLLRDVHRAANLLHELGIRRGSAVAIISPNCDDLITATLAAQLAGIAAPVNGALAADHVIELVRRAGARVLIAAAPELDAASWATTQAVVIAGLVDTVLLLRPTGANTAAPLPALAGAARVRYLIDGAADQDDSRFAGEEPSCSDLAALFHTGGTTGTPKLAAHTHTNETHDAWMIAANAQVGGSNVVFAGLPLFHVNALVVTVLAALLRGQTVVWAGPMGFRDPALYPNFWKIVEHYRIAIMSAVPTVYAALTQIPVDADLSSLRAAIVGASPLPDTVRKEFESHTGVALVQGYGLTEATCASASSFAEDLRPGSVGQRMPYQHIKAVRIDASGDWHDVPDGERGTLVIKGSNVFAGYVTGRNADGYLLDGNGTLIDGWLNTGDLGWVDADGFVYLTGRAKDLIIRGGHNIDPAVVEDALLAYPDVTAAAAVGRPDVHAGEVPVAYVTVTVDSSVSPEELLMWAAGHVSERAAAPKAVTILDALPATAVGKPDKLRLRADATRAAVNEALAGLAGIQTVTADVHDGSVLVTVTLADTADESAVRETLERHAFQWRLQRS